MIIPDEAEADMGMNVKSNNLILQNSPYESQKNLPFISPKKLSDIHTPSKIRQNIPVVCYDFLPDLFQKTCVIFGRESPTEYPFGDS